MSDDNRCGSCDGSGCAYSGVEYMGQREVVGCDDCWGTGFADVSQGVDSLRAGLEDARAKIMAAREYLRTVHAVPSDTTGYGISADVRNRLLAILEGTGA